MKKYNCEYENGILLKINNWKLSVEADDHYHAYKLFLDKAGVQQCRAYVQKGFLDGGMFFDDHMEVEEPEKRIEEEKAQTGEHTQEIAYKENSNLDQPNIDAKTQDLDIAYQESGWATFLNICGVLNLILFVIGGIWLLNARSSEQFIAMNLMIIGLVAAINSFFFAFLVSTFTRIQHNTHQTTLELKKLNNKTESKD